MKKNYLKCFLFLFLISGFLSLPAKESPHEKTDINQLPRPVNNETEENKLAKKLVDASGRGNLDDVRALIKQGVDVNSVYTPPDTCPPGAGGCALPVSQIPLIAACQAGHLDIVKELINAKANVNKSNTRKETPLMFASKSGNNDIVKALIAAGAKVNVKSNSYSSSTGPRSYTALYFASKNGHEEIVKTLLTAGAKVNLTDAENALCAAARGGYIGIVNKLRAAGAWVNPWEHKYKQNKDEIQIIFMKDTDSRACPNPLIEAINGRNTEIVKLLVKEGSNVNEPGCDNTTPLKAAIMTNQTEIAEILIKAGAAVDAKSSDGVTGRSYTPLELAYDIGNIEMIKILKGTGTSINKKDTTVLIDASAWGRVEKVKELISAGIDVNLQEEAPPWLSFYGKRCEPPSVYSATGQSALQKASEGGHLEVVKILLEAGAKVDDKNIVGDTALMMASRKGKAEIVKALLAFGADANARNNCGETPLTMADKAQQKDIVKILQEAGGKTNSNKTGNNKTNTNKAIDLIRASESGNVAKVKELVLSGVDINKKLISANLLAYVKNCEPPSSSYNTGETPLQKAAENGHREIVKILLTAGAKVDIQNSFGETALMLASKRGYTDIVKALLKAGADINLKNKCGASAETMARKTHQTDVVNILIRAAQLQPPAKVEEITNKPPDIIQVLPYNPNIREDRAIVVAASKNQLERVKGLLANNVDPDSAIRNGTTALMYASGKGYIEIIKTLLAANAFVDKTNNYGHTALIYASTYGQPAVMKELIKAGADVNAADRPGRMSLVFAVKKGNTEAVKILLSAGADVRGIKKTYGGKTALQIAQENGNEEIVKLLKAAGAKE